MSDKVKIILEVVTYRNMELITIRYPYDTEIIQRVKKLKGIRWSQDIKFCDATYFKAQFCYASFGAGNRFTIYSGMLRS